MSSEQAYTVKAPVLNNPLTRDVDVRQKREFGRTALLGGLVVAMVLFSAWQRNATVAAGMEIEKLQKDLAIEQVLHRQLLLNVEVMQAPQAVEARARLELGFEVASPTNTVVIEVERHQATPARSAVVARAR